MNYFINALKKYVDFKGRARRKEYWLYFLFYLVIMIVSGFLDTLIGTDNLAGTGSGVIYLLTTAFLFLPSLSVSVRRLHDIGKGGAWVLLWLLPIIGTIWMLVLMCKAGDQGANKYAADPR